MDINQIIVDAIAFNEQLNFMNLLRCSLIYLTLFWLAVSTWVYHDAKNRYESKNKAFLAAFLVFVFFFPALILYIAVRPEDIYGEEYEWPVITLKDRQENLEMLISLNLKNLKGAGLGTLNFQGAEASEDELFLSRYVEQFKSVIQTKIAQLKKPKKIKSGKKKSKKKK